MSAGIEWTTVLAGIVAGLPVLAVVGIALVLAAGGVIGCTQCVFGAFAPRHAQTPARYGRPVLHH